MKLFFYAILVFLPINLFSQNFEYSGGILMNEFYDNIGIQGHYHSSYKNGNGYYFGIGLNDLKLNEWRTRFDLQFENYKGDIKAEDGGLGAGFKINATTSKYVLGFGFFPANFYFFKKHLDINLGIVTSCLLYEKNEGTVTNWSMLPTYKVENIDNKYSQFNKRFTTGLKARIAYIINLSENLLLIPQYSYYFGLSSEFVEFPQETKSRRHYFGIGLKRSF